MRISRPSRPVRTQFAGLVIAAAGIVAQIIAGVKYGAVPPGLIVLLAAAVLVIVLPWRWAPLIGVVLGGFIFIGGFASTKGRADLSHPGHPGAFIGTVIQMVALAVAVVAGIAALAVRNRRPAGTSDNGSGVHSERTDLAR